MIYDRLLLNYLSLELDKEYCKIIIAEVLLEKCKMLYDKKQIRYEMPIHIIYLMKSKDKILVNKYMELIHTNNGLTLNTIFNIIKLFEIHESIYIDYGKKIDMITI